MFVRIFTGIALLTLIIGCATTQSPSTVNNLQIKVAHLERNLEEKDAAIRDLQVEVNQIKSRMDMVETYQDSDEEDIGKSDDIEEVDEGSPMKKTTAVKTSDRGIIRVNKSAKDVQQALKNAGYYNGPIDGKIGSGSKSAIVEFQKGHNLKTDGIIGIRTWQQLETYLE